MTRYVRRHSAGWAVAGLVVTLLGTSAVLTLLVTVPDLPPQAVDGLAQAPFTIVPYGVAGAVLIARRPDLPFGWLLSGAAAALAVSLPAVVWATRALVAGSTGPWVLAGLYLSGLGFAPVAVQGLINVRFPSGRPVTRWGRVLDRLLIAGLVLPMVGLLLGGGDVRDLLPAGTTTQLHRPFEGTAVARVGTVLTAFAPVVVLLGLVAGIGIVVRCLRADGIERQQLKWRALGVVVAFLLFPFAVTERLPAVANYLDSGLFVATLAIPVLRYRLWAIDTIIRRSAVYATVTALLVGAFALVTALGATVGAGLVQPGVTAAVAAVGVGLAFAPLRTATQRAVDHLFYGRRSEPDQALRDLARRLAEASVLDPVLPAVVSAVASSLRLPYVAIERVGDGEVLAASGDTGLAEGAGVQRWELAYQGVPVGSLVASPRRGEQVFDGRDCRVLADIARQAGPAVRAETLTSALLESRQRLVATREEERRRLRRDLHDGLGPTLTGLGLSLDAARTSLGGVGPLEGPEGTRLARADELLRQVKTATAQVILDVRELAYELRPPALDELGLVGAVTVHTERLGEGGRVLLDVDAEELPELPAAVEVAAFRTAVTAVRSAAAGQAVFGPALARRLRGWFATGPTAPDQPFPQLTAREREILDGVAAGLSNAQIGQRLFLSAKTVANNVSGILAKLQVGQRSEAVVRAREAGLGQLEPPG